MKIGSVQGFGARFTPECSVYLSQVKEQAEQSGRMNEFNAAKKALAFNFPQEIIKKDKSYRNREDIFYFNPHQEVRFSFKPNKSETNELDSFVKLAKEIRKISI